MNIIQETQRRLVQQGTNWSTAKVDAYLIALASTANTTSETIDLRRHSYRSSASNAAMAILTKTKNKIILVNEYLGRNLIKNGSFVDPSSWVLVGEANITDGVLNVISSAGAISYAKQGYTYYAGNYYKLIFDNVQTATGSAVIGNASNYLSINSSLPVGKRIIYFNCVDSDIYVKRDAICNCKLDNFELYECGRYGYTAIGDSITTPDSYANDLRTALGYCFYDHSLAGATIMANMDTQVAASAYDNADMIIIALGPNDNNAGDMTALRDKVELAIITLKVSNPNARIYYMNVLPQWTNVGGGTVVDKSNIRNAIATACTNQNVTCWDTFTDPWIVASDTSDGLHPTRPGDTKIKNRILALLA